MRHLLLRLGVVLLCLGSWPAAPARAHAHFADATPAPNSVLATPPPRVQVLFDEELDEEESQLAVYGPSGQRADRRDRQVDGARLWVSLADQGPGVYRVRWKAVAADDHGVTRGEFTFTIQPRLPAGSPQLAVSPGTVAAGQTVSLVGQGFSPNGPVVLTVGDAEDLLTVAQADAAGRVSAQVALPASLPFGRQVVQAADATGHYATYALWVPVGGQPAATVRLSAEAEAGRISYTLRVENRSGWHLRNVVVRVRVPAEAPVLFEGLGQPEGVEPPELQDDQLVWHLRTLPPHTIRGPFSFAVSTAGLTGRPTLTSVATIEYLHTASDPQGRGRAQSPEVRIQPAVR
jgi:methionine-rich copper-binding protein CopC